VAVEIQTATISALQYLRESIISGELEPGQKLIEKDLTSLLDISSIPLREAFRILQGEYLVISIPRKGVYVRNLSTEDLRSAFQAREMIECYVIKEGNFKGLREVASALNSAPSSPFPIHESRSEKIRYYKASASFHRKLVEASENYLLIDFYNSISSLLDRYLFIHQYIPGIRDQNYRQHYKILTLIKRGLYDQAEEKMRLHIRNAFMRLEDHILKNACMLQEEKDTAVM
jgi:DNA-binding GntR family transcriptional regulator